ncbi:unnamed protein product, partial [Lymnaea stagnalis]
GKLFFKLFHCLENMPTLFGKMAGFVTSIMPGRESQTEAAVAGNQHPAVDDDDDLERLPSIVRDYRAYLVRAIYAGEETEEIIQKLIELECPKLEDKYYAVRARDLISLNNKSFQDLKNIHSGLGYIVKYAKYLFKDPDKRKDQWRMIPFKNPHYQKKIKPLQGSETLLMQLGYTEQTEQGLRFPQGQEPEREKVVNLIADMMLFKKELKEYILDKHPRPQHIEQLLPQQTRDEVLAFRLSGLKIDDENVDAASGQSSIAYYNSPASSTPTPQNHVQTHNSSSLNLECNNNNSSSDIEPKLTEETEATKKTEQVPTPESPLLAEGQAGTPAAAEVQGNLGDMQAIQDLVSSQEEVTDAVPSRSEGGSSSSSKRYSCSVCGEDAVLFCTGCSNKMLCENCNVNWHKHPARSQHPQMHRAESVSALISITPDSSLQLVFDATYGIHQTNNTKLSKKQQTYVMDQKSRIKKPERDQLYGNVPDLASLGQDILPGNSYSVHRTLYRNQQPNDYQILDYQRQQIHPSLYPMPNVLSSKNMSPYMNYPDENVIGHGLSQGDPHQQLHRPKQPLPQHLLESPEGLPSYVVQQLRDQQKRNLIGPFPSQQHPVPMPGSGVYVHNQTYPQAQPMSELGLPPSYTSGPGSMYPPQLPSASLQKHSSNMYYGVAHPPYRPSAPLHGGHDLNMYGQFSSPALHVHHGSAGYGPQMTRPYPGNNPGIMTSVASSGYYTDYQDNKLTPSSKYIQRLLQEPDIHKRKVKCENYIDDYEMDLKDLEKEFNDRLLEIDEFSESEVCRDMNKRKAALLKEKRNLEMFRNNMDTEPQKAPPTANLSHYKQEDQQIYYPPEIEKASLRPSRLQTPPSNYGQTAVQKAAKTEGFQQGDPGVYNRNTNNTGKLKATAAAGTVREEGRKAGNSQQYKNAKSNTNQGVSRIPVESSSSVDDNFDIIHLPPPDIPPRPRPGSEESILNKIIHPPRQPGMFHPKQWQCQHCTYINEPTAHACSMCDKTSTNPELISDQFDEDHIGEIDNDHDQNEADISHEMSLKNDALLQMMAAGEGHDESFLSIDPDETPVVGANIIGSQIQVMLEKQRAQEEYQQRMDRQVTASPLLTASRSESQSPTPSSKTVYGVGARPKKTNSPRPDLTAGEVSLSGASDYHTPPSGLSPPPSTPPKGHPTSVSKLKESGSDNGGRMSSLEDALARYNEQTLIETLQAEGAQLSKLIKKADQEGFEVEAVQVALTFCEHQKMGPLEWLRSNWNRNVEKVIAMATAIGNKQQCNSVGELTASEAQSAYISCHANMKEAAQLCADRRIKLFEYLSQLGDFPREEILQTMNQCQGEQEASEYQLLQSNLQHFMDHIWAQKDSGQSSRFAFPDITSSDVCHSLSTSVIAHSDFQKMIKNKLIPTDRRIRLILVEGCLKSWGRAELVIKILDNDLPDEDIALEDVVEAVRNCQDRLSAIAYLQQECAVCFTKFPMSKIRSLNFCQCKMCEQCLATNFEIVIREKHVRHWTCPLCSLPDLNDTEIASDYLQFLTMLLQPLVSQELQNLFEIKVRDWHLQKDPNFRWCAHCAEGFLAENRGHQLRLTCPHCGEKTCFSCKKEWEEQHEGLTCEEYAQWKIDNDPNNQSVGLAKHLDENGIDCPMCKMRFALAKGGCMHFKCPNCGHEFCSGCNEPYHHKEVCNKYKTCKNLGLHCHCPRDCFSYMRDYSVPQLQTLLKQHKVPFNVRTPDDQPDAMHCPVMEQKEFDLVKKDEKCGKESVDGQAGLCELHYKEYLVDIINRHKLDPLSLMTRDAMIVLIRRYDLAVPHQKVGDTPEAYLACLTKVKK